jgi:hypothetical protein
MLEAIVDIIIRIILECLNRLLELEHRYIETDFVNPV